MRMLSHFLDDLWTCQSVSPAVQPSRQMAQCLCRNLTQQPFFSLKSFTVCLCFFDCYWLVLLECLLLCLWVTNMMTPIWIISFFNCLTETNKKNRLKQFTTVLKNNSAGIRSGNATLIYFILKFKVAWYTFEICKSNVRNMWACIYLFIYL